MKKTLPKKKEIPKSELKRIKGILPEKEPELKGDQIIPVGAPLIGKKEQEYVLEAAKSGWVSSAGKYVDKFEELFAKKVSNTKYAFSVNSGTSAMHVALAVLGIGEGDEVIVPTFTMIATANAVSYTGAKPVFVDADLDTWNIDIEKIEEKITKKTKAIIPVHIYGLCCDMGKIKKLAKKHDLWVIEDAAEAHGAEFKGKRAGSFGDVSAFSFFANKVITTGEGGMVTTNSSKIADLIEKYRNNGYGEYLHFWHKVKGFGYRMSNLEAAVGLGQVEKFEKFLKKRREDAKLYRELLSKIPGLKLPVEPKGYKSTYWMFGIVVDENKFGMNKGELREFLAKNGVETRSFFIPMHIQPIYFKEYGSQKFPVAEELARDGLYLPSGNALKKSDIRFVCKKINEAANLKTSNA